MKELGIFRFRFMLLVVYEDCSNYFQIDRCRCGNCKPMPTGLESLCCHVVPRVDAKAQECNLVCISEDEDFKTVCLNPAVVLRALCQCIEDEEYIHDAQTFEYVFHLKVSFDQNIQDPGKYILVICFIYLMNMQKYLGLQCLENFIKNYFVI